MALIKCPECGKEVSSRAKQCIHCGCPLTDFEFTADESKQSDVVLESSSDASEEPQDEKVTSQQPELASEESVEETTKEISADTQPEKKINKKGIIIAVCAVLACAGIGIGVYFGTANLRKYNAAGKLLESGDYQAALESYSEIPDYKDAAIQANECKYQIAAQLQASGSYADAINQYNEITDYRDSSDQILECKYQIAVQEMDSGDYKTAMSAFTDLGDYSDSQIQANECCYQIAMAAYKSGDLDTAINNLETIPDYSDATDKLNAYRYERAQNFYAEEKWADAESIFTELGDYEDSAAMAEASAYQQTTDGQFLLALKKGLQDRWAYIDLYEVDGSTEPRMDTDDYYEKLVNFEYDRVSGFAGQTFDDERLGEIASEYVAALDECLESLKYYNVNFSNYSDMWDSARASRTHLISELVADYNLTVDEDYTDDLEDLVTDSDAYYEEEQIKADAQTIADNAVITSDPYVDDYTGSVLWYDYTITVTNTSDVVFDYLYINVQILDSDGNIIGSGMSENIDNFQVGQSATVGLYLDSSDDVDYSNYTLVKSASFSSGNYYSD